LLNTHTPNSLSCSSFPIKLISLISPSERKKKMIQIGNKLISLDILEQKFVCNLAACKGACCVQGDAGAPVEDDEREVLEREYSNFKNELTEEGRLAVETEGKYVTDGDGDWVTPLNNGKECAYTVFENGIAKCGIERAWAKGKTSFRKPVSCHLYPIRVTRLGSLLALNYHSWIVCKPAIVLGKKTSTPVFRFLKEPIIRAYGEEFFNELEIVEKTLLNNTAGSV